MSFDSLGLSAELLRALAARGYSQPTPIQTRAIPVVLEGRDVLAAAQVLVLRPRAHLQPARIDGHDAGDPGVRLGGGHRVVAPPRAVRRTARLGLGVSILSYAGQVRLGVATDSGLVPDPQSIIQAFQEEMTAMMADK